MAINFSDKILITNQTAYHLGLVIAGAGILAIILGIVTHFTGDILIPASGWCALGIPPIVIGGILVGAGITKP